MLHDRCDASGKSWRGNLRDVIGSTDVAGYGWNGSSPDVDIQWLTRHPYFSKLCNKDTKVTGREALCP